MMFYKILAGGWLIIGLTTCGTAPAADSNIIEVSKCVDSVNRAMEVGPRLHHEIKACYDKLPARARKEAYKSYVKLAPIDARCKRFNRAGVATLYPC